MTMNLPGICPEADAMLQLPGSASDLSALPAGGTALGLGAYIRNPVADRPMLTPVEAMEAVSILSATLCADERFRTIQAGRRVFNG